jgi:hypothetical protein
MLFVLEVKNSKRNYLKRGCFACEIKILFVPIFNQDSYGAGLIHFRTDTPLDRGFHLMIKHNSVINQYDI